MMTFSFELFDYHIECAHNCPCTNEDFSERKVWGVYKFERGCSPLHTGTTYGYN